MNEILDVVVIGAGPAGSAVATFLARQGRRCLLLDSHHFPRYHVGESLIPKTYPIFDQLGFLPKLRASAFPEKRSVRFVARDGTEGVPFYFTEILPPDEACTWQVERGDFDRMLLQHAKEAGVIAWEDAHVDRVIFEGDQAVGVSVVRDTDTRTEVRCRVVVDASGRACFLGRQLGLKTVPTGLKKASVWSYFKGAERPTGIDAGETTIFLLPDGGWFWFIPLPDDVVSVGVVGDADRINDFSPQPEIAFHLAIESCPALKARLASASMVGRIRAMNQLAYWNRKTSGDGWVMLGDARAFLDPIYSSGLFLALTSAQMAARTINEGLRCGDLSGAQLGRFEPTYNAGVEVMRRLIHAFYDPGFSFPRFLKQFPEHRADLIGCLIGDVFRDLRGFQEALATFSTPPEPICWGNELATSA